jgi:predicted transcriptional regulator
MYGSVDIQRDRIYIVKDLILKLVEYGELNQTTLLTFCRLNLKKHRPILYDLELNELIIRNKKQFGKRMVTVYKPTQKGIEFCRNTLDPYEKMFPRRKSNIDIIENEEKANDKPSGVDETHLLIADSPGIRF